MFTRKSFNGVVLFFLLLSLSSLSADFAGGSGTEEDPWLIETADHLNNVRNYLGGEHFNTYFIQMADIDLGVAPWNEGEGWVPIGNAENAFRGKYEGNGKKIIGLTINRPEGNLQGLFGYLEVAYISNLSLLEVEIIGGNLVGALAGDIYINVSVDNCSSSGSVTGSFNTGGLIGRGVSSWILNSYNQASVSGDENVGGLIGYKDDLFFIRSSYNSGNVSGINNVGGLVGHQRESEIINSYSVANVNGTSNVGGLVGNLTSRAWSSLNSLIDRSYSAGEVIGVDNVGGLAGNQQYSRIINSYSVANVNGTSNIGGLVGSRSGFTMDSNQAIVKSYSAGEVIGDSSTGGLVGVSDNQSNVSFSYWDTEASGLAESADGFGRTTSQMTYPYSLDVYEDWDFSEIWEADVNYQVNNGYPFLREPAVSIDEIVIFPETRIELTNFPNPFNPETTIKFSIPHKSSVRLDVYNLKGQIVKVLLNEIRDGGEHQVAWNGRDEKGIQLSSGVYFYRIRTEKEQMTGRMLMMK